jgi:sugar lactone lactonase YvrE
MVSTFAGTAGVGTEAGVGGQATSASFSPHGLATRTDGVIYFSDENSRKLYRIGLDGVLSLVLTGSGLPTGIIARDNGDLFFNTYNGGNRIQKYIASTMTTSVWSSASTNFNSSRGAISDSAGNIYVADSGNHQVKKIDTTGAMTIIAGTGISGGTGDGGSALAATVAVPTDVAVDSAGTVYFTELTSNKIRKITSSGTMLKVLGDGTGTYSGDGGLATNARTTGVWGIAVDGGDNLFFVEKDGSAIRRIDATTGIVTRVAGTGTLGTNGSPVNGISSIATFSNLLMVLRFDRNGNLFIIDYSNRVIRKISGIGTPFSTPAATVSLSTVSNVMKGVFTTLSTSVGAAGRVTFFANGKRIPGCIGKSASGSTPIAVTCSWKPNIIGSITIRAILTPTDNSLSTATTQISTAVTRRSTLR